MICTYIYIYIARIYIYISEGLRPLPPAPKLRIDDTTIRCFDALLTADHLYPIGSSRACLLRSILALGDGFGSHLGGLGDILGMGGVPDWPGDARMGWIALPSGREHCFAWIQGSRA